MYHLALRERQVPHINNAQVTEPNTLLLVLVEASSWYLPKHLEGPGFRESGAPFGVP